MSKKGKKKKKINNIIHYIFTFFRTLFITLFVLGCIFALFLAAAFKPIYDGYKDEAKYAISQSDYDDFKLNLTGYIYDKDGKIIKKLSNGGNSIYLKSEDIPEYVKQAFVAVEDRNFYSHSGFDVKGIIRVCLNYLKSGGEEKHGASTITQQLVKNMLLSSEVTMERKIKEIFYSVELEKKYTKDEILEFYINDIYFANQYYGIESASLGYFGRSTNELSLSEIAFLCAIPNSPTYYDPLTNYDNTITRRNKILNDMLECEFITNEEYNKAINEEIILDTQKSTIEFANYETTYAIECAIRYLMKYNGFEFQYSWKTDDDYEEYRNKYLEAYDNAQTLLYTKGYKIYTTIDPVAQDTLQESLDNVLSFDTELQDDGTYALQGAITCIDNTTGKVVAIIGGRTQENNNIYTLNRAYQSYRQPGSTIKPLVVYTPALMSGYNKNSVLYNISVTEANTKGVNIDELTGPSMSLSYAVENSINGSALYLFNQIGVRYGLSFLPKMKFNKILPSDYNISAGLGGLTLGTTTEQMASGYFTLVNHGDYVEPTCIYSIIDSDGNEIYKDDELIEVYTDSAADNMVQILKGVITSGTAKSMRWYNQSNIEAAGKTGTTNDNKDGWFCGFTPYYTIAVWVGFDQPRSMNNLYGSSYPANIWKEAMLSLTKDLEDKEFERSLDTANDIYYHGSADIELTDSSYQYLAGRDDSEVLSDGYTVYDYRVDRTIGESVYEIIDQINNLDKNSATYYDDLNNLYNQGLNIISTIYSTKYTNEMLGYLNNAYNSKF